MTTKGLCPYCGTKDVAMKAVHEWKSPDGHRGLMLCGHCSQGIIREFLPGNNSVTVTQYNGDVSSFNVILLRQWPEPVSSDAPADCPENVSRFFKQAVDSLNSANYDAAGMMFRKSIEAATKSKSPDLAGIPLVKRIDALVTEGTLTKDLGAWAHEVRLGGNDAAHEEDPFTIEEAKGLLDFCENFLRYAFTLPAAVGRRTSPAS